MESIPTTTKSLVFFTSSCGGWNQFQRQQKAWYSLLIHAENGTNSRDSKKGGILYLLMLLDMYGDLFNFFWLFGTESRR
jgi:hypothetical protein